MTMRRQIRWGILGTGWVAQRFLADLRYVDGALPLAIASRDKSRADDLAARYRLERAHGTYEALVRDPNVDVIYVASTPQYHAEHCLAAISEGKHVICEKPFAVSTEDARKICEAAREKKVFCMEAMWTRFLPATIYALQQVDAGLIGAPHFFTADFSIPVSQSTDNRLMDSLQGGGALLDRGVYAISFAIRLFGKPKHVAAVGNIGKTGVDTTASALLTFADGKFAALTTSVAEYSHNSATIAGREGRLHIAEPFYRPERITVTRAPRTSAGQHSDLNPDSAGENIRRIVSRLKTYLPAGIQRSTTNSFPSLGYGYAYEAREVGRCLSEGLIESPLMPLHDSLQCIETVESVRNHIRE